MLGRHRLEPYRLPDAARRRVIDAGRRSRYLLPDRLVGPPDRIEEADHELVRPTAVQEPRDVEREGVVVAAMRCREPAVDVDVGLPADRAEVQDHASRAPGSRDRERSPVPPPRVGALNPRQWRLDGERNEDRLGQAVPERGSLAHRPPLVLPTSVKAQPLRALQLRPGIGRERRDRRDRASPACRQRRQLSDIRRRRPGCGRQRAGEYERGEDRPRPPPRPPHPFTITRWGPSSGPPG